MISSYALRLTCLSLACFFLLNLIVGLGVAAAARPILRIAGRRSAREATRMLLWIRLLPSAFAISVVAILCVPSYLYLEPHFDAEPVGAVCAIAAIFGAAVLCAAVARTIAAIERSSRMLRGWKRSARPLQIAGAKCLRVPRCFNPRAKPLARARGSATTSEPRPQGSGYANFRNLVLVSSGPPLIALAGLFRQRVLVSSEILETLPADELELAISHERAHAASADNWKRLLLALAPDAAPFLRLYGNLERGWVKFTEWAADEAAAQGDPRRSLSLASALVRVARLSAGPELPSAISPLVADRAGLAARVERLLRPSAAPPRAAKPRSSALLLTALASTALAAFTLSQTATLVSVHEILEQLIR